jgi:phosphatidate cytidylyltransferase
LWRKWPQRNWSAIPTGIIVLLPPVLLLMFMPPKIVLGLCAVVWVADISAYFSGRAIGDKKLAPNISPGKTWAGALGAVIGVLVYCNVVLFLPEMEIMILRPPLELSTRVGLSVFLQVGFIGLAVMSIVGDLFESLLKRQAGVKDSSHLLPGHGGILDRIDSLTSTVPCVFLLFTF